MQISASTQADDGMPLIWNLGFCGTVPSTLPSSDAMEAAVKAAAAKLDELRQAPLAENGTAVILFEGMAAAQLVQVLLAPRLSGAPPWRLTPLDMDQSLASKLGMQVTSSLLDVYDDPTQALGPRGEPLWGSYAADDEGVTARKVSLIERGILKTLLMSRAPRKETRQSNGHRRGTGPEIGNLIVKANVRSRAKSWSRWRCAKVAPWLDGRRVLSTSCAGSARAPSRCICQPTFTMHMPLHAGAGLMATEAYLLEGGKEKLVRGLVLDQLDVKLFKDVLGVGRDAYVLNHMASGVPAAIVAPALLVSDVDVRKHEAENPKLPSYAQP